jgi:riboflavin synthase
MFTGIVQAVGEIESVTPGAASVRIAIDAGPLDVSGVAPGDSICVQGACLTVVSLAGRKLGFDVSRETLACTVGLARPGAVNLERSLALGAPLGGHLVAGHVDGVGEVLAVALAGESRLLRVRAPRELVPYLARKGSISVDGVSLTVNRVRGAEFEVNLIPHTLAATTLGRVATGTKVNLEADLVARYVAAALGAAAPRARAHVTRTRRKAGPPRPTRRRRS